MEAVDVLKGQSDQQYDQDEGEHACVFSGCLDSRSGIFQYNLEDDVPDIATAVDDLFKRLVQIEDDNDF